MASDGLGKIKNKRNKDTAKPYDRPKTFFSRISSSLSEMLMPTWCRESPCQSTNNEEEEDESEDMGMEEPEDQMGDSQTGDTVHGLQIQRLSSELAEGSVQATEDGVLVECGGYHATFSTAVLSEDEKPVQSTGPSGSRTPLGVACGDLTSNLPRSEMQPSASCVSSGSSSANYLSAKRSAPQHSGDDSSSNTSDASHSEMVGAPLKKRCVDRNNVRTAFVDPPNEEPVKETSSRKGSFLWSTSVNQSRASGSGSLSRRAPAVTATAASGTKPGFDVATFCGTINHSEQGQRDSSMLQTSYMQSPFYKGKTTYGGASSRSRHVNYDPDYQVVMSVRQPVKKIEPTSDVSRQVTLSTTAKRILESLDKNEQQLDDTAITSNQSGLADSPLSFTPSTYRRNSLQVSGSRTQFPLSMGPPVREQTTPTFAVIKQSIGMYQGRQQDETLVRRTENMEQNVAKSSTYASATYDLPLTAPSTQGPGKMRREQTRKHYSNRTAEKEDEMPMSVDLPTIALPVTNLQPFTSSALCISSAGFFGKIEPEKAKTFTFSEPITRNTENKATEDVQAKRFHFSYPIAVDSHRSNNMSTSPSQQPSVPSAAAVSEPAAKSKLAFDFNLKTAVKKVQTGSETLSLGFAPASELKRGSVMDLLGRPPSSSVSQMDTSTSSSGTSLITKPVSSAAGAASDGTKPWSELCKVPTNKWSCPECFVSNDNNMTKCPCCSASKPAAKPAAPAPAGSSAPAQVSVPTSSTSTAKPLSEMFKPSNDIWICPTCSVRNGNSLSECPCCCAKQPGGSKTDNQPSTNSVSLTGDAEKNEVSACSELPSLLSLFQKPPGDWVCPTCSVQNKEDRLKCCACEEPKPGAKTAPSNGANATAPSTAASVGQAEPQGFKFNPAAFGSSAVGQSVFKAPSSTDGGGIAPNGGFRMNLPSGGFSMFGSSGFSIPQSQSDKEDSVPISGGFKPTGFVNFGQILSSSGTNGPSTKPEVMSFLPLASSTTAQSEARSVTPSFAGGQFGSIDSKPGGFSFKSSVESETGLKAASVGFTFGSSSINPLSGGKTVESGFQFGEKVTGDKSVDNTSGVLLRPPLRASEDKGNEPFRLSGETNTGSSSQNNCAAPRNSFQATVGIFGAPPTAFSSTTFAPPVSSAPSFSFGVPVSTSVVSTPAPLFGLAKPSTDVSAPKFSFTSTLGSNALPMAGFGAPSTSLAIGVTQPVFTAPSSITSAAIAPPCSVDGGFFAPPVVPVNKPATQEAAKSNLFSFSQNPTDAVPVLFKFGETQPVKEEAKPAAANIFQFGQQSQNTAPSNLFQFGASSNTASSVGGIFSSTTSQPAAAAPVFGQPPAPMTAPGIFKFGAGTGTQTNSAGAFTFGAKQPDGASKPDVMPSFSQLGNKRSMGDDGVISKRGRSGSGFAFNTPQASAAVDNPGFFGPKPANPGPAFGNPSSTTPAGASFTFTGQQPAPGFGNQNMSNMANGSVSTGFTFGAGAAAPTVPTAFNFSATPSFNFAATSSNPSGNVTFNAQPSAAPPAGRTIKKAVRRAHRK